MKIWHLHIWKRMMAPSCGYVILAWHRKPWWTWGLWWFPTETRRFHFAQQRWMRLASFTIPFLGQFQFQRQ